MTASPRRSIPLTEWRPAIPGPRLEVGDVDVWRFSTVTGESAASQMWLLSDPEKERAAALRDEGDRAKYVASHVAMRTILGGYVELPPESLKIEEGDMGKPFLSPSGGLEFSLSHSGAMGLLAVARKRRVGVDIERKNPEVDYRGMTAMFFSEAERERIAEETHPVDAFYHAWSRNEAYAKATGQGISQGFAHIEIAVSHWAIYTLDAHVDYVAALVVSRPIGKVSLLDLSA